VLCMGIHHFMPEKHGLPVMAKVADVAAQFTAYKLNKRAERLFLDEDEEEIFGGMSQEEFVESIMAIAIMVQKASREEAKHAASIKTKGDESSVCAAERHRFAHSVHRVEPVFVQMVDVLAERTYARLADHREYEQS